MNNTLKQLWSVIGLWLLALNANQAWAAITYVHTDHLGSVIAESNSAGQITKRFHYKPFGESIESQQDDIGYSAHKYDVDIGLSYMQARYYDPVLGRFMSPDPIGLKDQFNLYAYVGNDPLNKTDPTGMCTEEERTHGCLVTGKTAEAASSNNKEIDPSSPGAVNVHAMVGDGSARNADFTKVKMNDLGKSLQKLAGLKGTALNKAIEQARKEGGVVGVNMKGVKAGGGFDGKTPLSQKGAIGRFAVTVAGGITVDDKGNWSMNATVSGEADVEDYPVDSNRTGTASALTSFGSAVQGALGGQDYSISFHGSQDINITGQ